MWKKGEMPEPDRMPSREAPTYGEPAPAPAPRPGGQAVIGRSIAIRGEVTGDEDLVIQGRVDGSVNLGQHAVTVGPEGQVKANIEARIVTVEGKVEGNLTADEQVLLRRSSWVHGDIKAPRVVLEDGAHFRGGVEMGEEVAANRRAAAAASNAPAQKPASQPDKPAPQPEKPAAAAGQPSHAASSNAGRSGGGRTADVKG